MSRESKVVRDFIYVDVERLYSLYSQVFEGVADQIVQSYINASSSTDTQKESLLKGGSLEAQVAEMSRRTESKFLYDHMYNLFETEIQNAISAPSGISSQNYREQLENVFMLKVNGKAEVEDYNRVKLFAEQFNELVSGIAFANTTTQTGVSLHQAEALLEATNDKALKTQVRNYIQRLKAPEKLAKEQGWYQDEKLLSMAQLFTEMFYPEGFDITIMPLQESDEVVFRGVLDRRWLRVQPNFLKALYGGYTEFQWTMVGQVTYMPGGKGPSASEVTSKIKQETAPEISTEGKSDESENKEEVIPEISSEKSAEESPSMRDPFRGLIGALRRFERMFLESKQRVEIVVCPLAIYREMPIPPATMYSK
jgi:hypothetical protein